MAVGIRGRAASMAMALALAVSSSGCGKTLSNEVPPPTGGVPASEGGASGNGATSGGGSSSPGAAAGAVAASGGTGGTPASILAPLSTDDDTIDGASGEELLELTMSIGYARAWALCACHAPQPLPENELVPCADSGVSFTWYYHRPGPWRCLLEKSSAVPGFDERLRCWARALRVDGQAYAACADGTATDSTAYSQVECAYNGAADSLLAGDGCRDVVLCDEGRLLEQGRCDRKLDCDDGADERGCQEVKCGDLLLDRYEACDAAKCDVFDPPLCSPGMRVVCGDGQQVAIRALCDGAQDCATGRDEEYCY